MKIIYFNERCSFYLHRKYILILPMGVSDRKEREKEEMRRKILDAAKTLFLELGFEKTSIRNIADAIEYSPGTIYLYFKDKNELFFALHQEAFMVLLGQFSKVTQVEDPLDKLVVMGKEYLTFAFENPELYDLMFLMSAPIETLDCCNEIWMEGIQAFNLVTQIVTECINKGYFKDQNAEDLSMTFWASVHGLASIHLRKRSTMFLESERIPRLERAFDVLIDMIKKL